MRCAAEPARPSVTLGQVSMAPNGVAKPERQAAVSGHKKLEAPPVSQRRPFGRSMMRTACKALT